MSAETQARRGRLRIFLSYAPGAGKTRAMLDAALRSREAGVDLVAAFVTTHAEPELTERLKALETLPGRHLPDRGGTRVEMDMDAILARRPQAVVVDNLAHTNPPGLRHTRRYQDVEELLEAGIDVFATLDIYNLESHKDIVEQITGKPVQETIPDHVLREAAQIELVDIPPEELLDRIQQRSARAQEPEGGKTEPLFRLGDLMALRELALRYAANQVDAQMRGYMRSRDISGPWPATERLMVCISSHPLSERLVRTGRRMADALNAEWFVVYIETPDRLRFSASHHGRLIRAIRLAEELGARVITISGRTVPEAVQQFAQQQNITKIIVGRPIRSRLFELLNGSIVDEIIRGNRSIDVYVISDSSGAVQTKTPARRMFHSGWRKYLLSALLVAMVTAIGYPVHFFIDPSNLVMIFLLAVMASALYIGRGPSLLASLLSALSFDFFFIEPRLSFSIEDTQYLLTFFGLLIVSLVISNLAGLVRDQVAALRRQESQTNTLYALSRELTVSLDLQAVLDVVVRHVGQTLGREAAILLPEGNQLKVCAASEGFGIEEQEMPAAAWAMQHGQASGRGTNTLSSAKVRFEPLHTAQGVIGILAVRPTQPESYLTPDQRQLLEAYSSLAALAIERARLAEQANQAQILSEGEKLQTALLNSISHDLRTPLASITGVFSSLHEAEEAGDHQVVMDRSTRLELIETGWEESDRLNRLVGNLLNMSRLESGAMRLRKEEGDIEEVIGSALARLKVSRRGITVKIHGPSTRPLVPMDFSLIEQVLINLVENAVKYSDPGENIEIQIAPGEADLRVSVLDRGKGIPDEDLGRIFDKFYRVSRRDDVGGTGLGLSICKGIIEAHGGQIWAENRAEGGSIFTFSLPLREQAAARQPVTISEQSQYHQEGNSQ